MAPVARDRVRVHASNEGPPRQVVPKSLGVLSLKFSENHLKIQGKVH